MTSHRSPPLYELPQPHASTSKQTAIAISPRAIFQPVDQNRPEKRSSNDSSPRKGSKGPKRARAATPIAAPQSEQSQDREPSTALFVPEEEGDEGVIFSEEQAEEDEEEQETLIPETTEPLGIDQAEADCDPEEDVDGHGGKVDPLDLDQGDHVQLLDAEDGVGGSEDPSIGEDDVDDHGRREDYGDMEESHEAQDNHVQPSAAGPAGADAQPSEDFLGTPQESSDGYQSETSSSYHSGDSDLFDMDHRPMLERTLVKKDLHQLMSDFSILPYDYQILDRLGEGEAACGSCSG